MTHREEDFIRRSFLRGSLSKGGLEAVGDLS